MPSAVRIGLKPAQAAHGQTSIDRAPAAAVFQTATSKQGVSFTRPPDGPEAQEWGVKAASEASKVLTRSLREAGEMPARARRCIRGRPYAALPLAFSPEFLRGHAKAGKAA